jgi:hypothetical protein
VWIFFIFWSTKISVNPTCIFSSLSPQCRLSPVRRRHTVAPCHTYFPLSQYELAASASSSDNALSHRLPSRTKTEALNLYHRCRLPSLDHPTLTLHCYKKIISNLVTLLTTQSHLHFAFYLAKASCHWSSTHRRHSLSLLSDVYRPSAQRHSWWQTSRPSFAFRIAYQHVNSCKKLK